MKGGEHRSEQLKADIQKIYNVKTNIFGPAACSMAMHLEFSKRAKDTRKAKYNDGQIKDRGGEEEQQTIKPPLFAKEFMYGGQGTK